MACARLNNAFTLLGDNWSALVQSSQAAVGYKYNYTSTKVIMVICTYCTKFEVAQCTVAVSNRVVRTQLDTLRIAQHCFRIFALYKHYTLSYPQTKFKIYFHQHHYVEHLLTLLTWAFPSSLNFSYFISFCCSVSSGDDDDVIN